MDLAALRQELIRDEGLRLTPYKDTMGNETLGVGHLMSRKFSRRAMLVQLEDDIAEHWHELLTALPWVDKLDDVRQRVLLNMAFNLGVPGLLHFITFLEHLHAGRYEDAADAMLKSLWARQVKGRALRLAQMMRTGKA